MIKFNLSCLKLLVPTCIFLSFSLLANSQVEPNFRNSITWVTQGQIAGEPERTYVSPLKGSLHMIQGATSEDQAQFNILTPARASYTFRVFREDSNTRTLVDDAQISTTNIQLGLTTYKVIKVLISNLDRSGNYILEVTDSRTRPTVFDERHFKTDDGDSNSSVNVACFSCMSDMPRFRAEGELLTEKLESMVNEDEIDLMIGLGDFVYADAGEYLDTSGPNYENQILSRYIASFISNPITRFKNLVPLLGTMDDHDWGQNDVTADFIQANPDSQDEQERANARVSRAARFAWEALFGSVSLTSNFERGPGVSSKFITNGQQIVILDGRSFRQSDSTGLNFSHLGQEQEDWLIETLENSSRPVWIGKGDQFFSQYEGRDSFAISHPEDFQRFMQRLADTNKPFFFLSGDVHFSEVQRLNLEEFSNRTNQVILEVTSSALHSFKRYVITDPDTAANFSNSNRVEGELTEQYNFVLLNGTPNGQEGLDLEISSIGIMPDPNFLTNFRIFSVVEDVQENLNPINTPNSQCAERFLVQ